MTTSTLESRIQAMDSQMLTPIVLKALQRDSGVLAEWQVEPLKSTAGVGAVGPSVVYRLTGRLQTQDEFVPWSLVLKVLSPALVQGDHPLHFVSDLEREFNFYQSELPRRFPPGFRAVACYQATKVQNEVGQREYWLRLEDMAPSRLSFADEVAYYQLAYSLGCLNGYFLYHQPLPTEPWLRKQYVRDYLRTHETAIDLLIQQRDHPLVGRAFPPALVDDYAALWRAREQHLSTLDKLPQTLCHQDTTVQNLFLTTKQAGQREVVAIDWAVVGIAALGQDPAQLLWTIIGQYLYGPSLGSVQLSAYAETVFAGYLAGLQVQNWSGNPRLARLGYTTALIRAQIGSLRSISLLLAETPSPGLTQRLHAGGMTLADFADNLGQFNQFLSDLFQESLSLRDELL